MGQNTFKFRKEKCSFRTMFIINHKYIYITVERSSWQENSNGKIKFSKIVRQFSTEAAAIADLTLSRVDEVSSPITHSKASRPFLALEDIVLAIKDSK